LNNKALRALGTLICLLTASAAYADKPVPWQMDLQQAATPIMEEVRWFNYYTLWFVVPITLFVLALLVIVVVRFRASKNPVPSRVSHNTFIEIVWTIAPIVVLVAFALPSFQLLTNELTQPEKPDMTLKVIATQWKWNYEYPADSKVSFESRLLDDNDRSSLGKTDINAYPRLLAVDNEMVVPVNKVIRVIVTADPEDVIHSFAMQSFGVKVDAVPGRMNETWFKAEKEGLYYGQCSELCGKDHAFMPIAIRVVPEDSYKAWLTAAATDLPSAYKALVAAVDGKKTVDVAANVAK
jgi:cytochrome c oxidase subunit 2